MFSNTKLCSLYFLITQLSLIQSQLGPDPWDYPSKHLTTEVIEELNLPPDIRLPQKRKVQSEQKLGIAEWFFRRILTIVLKGGQIKNNEDGSVDISLQMKLDANQWEILTANLKSETPLTEDMLRRTVGYVQESIYKPSIVEKISMAWSEYIQIYLTENKTYITWTLCFLAAARLLLWLWNHMSHKNLIITAFIIFYAYEVVISYKEAEKKELETFLAAIDRCKWYFWTSSCEVPPPDPIVFLKHMNPMKIGIRMFTTALSEPLIAITGTIDVILHGVTDGLWYPFNTMAYGILSVIISVALIFFFIMIIFNWLLNIPFHLSFGFLGVSIMQRKRTLLTENVPKAPSVQNTETINVATLDKILNVFSLALANNTQNRPNVNNNNSNNVPMSPNTSINTPQIRRSASTGRLPNIKFGSNSIVSDNTFMKRKPRDGSGDAF